MTYFVTGATGFIGRNLVQRLVERHDGDIHVLVREGSRGRMEELIEGWGARDRVHPVIGDLQQPKLGVDDAWIAEHQGKIDHVFHLAAIYDMAAGDEQNETLNVGGTRQLVALVNDLRPGVLHHVSSIAVAGAHKGLFREDQFDEGQKLPTPYHRTKFESERIVREGTQVPWRVYRPAVVIGDSQTGEMDKIDGPYYFFKVIQRLRDLIPQWVPLAGPEIGDTNIVPVDYVADALEAIAHKDGLDGQAFHLAAPRMTASGDAMNAFARAAHAPQLAVRVDKRLTDALPKGVFSLLMQLPALKDVRKSLLADLGIPDEVLTSGGFRCTFDTRDTERALEGTGIAVPELDSYSEVIWDYWERNLDPDLFKDRSLRAAVNGKTVVITGGSSGIGRSAALKIAAAGGIPLLVARGE
jgi:thioester reductase-like protein